MKPQTVTYQEIVRGLEDLGLCKGDRVMVHSSLSAMGHVDGGADTVIRALLDVVGSDGLVVVPTFGGKQPFDRHNTPTTLGIIADRFWRRPDAVRSLHPTHSVAAIGKGAEELIKDHEKAPTAYGQGTPYHRLATSGGKILLIGVDQDRNTTLHTAEALAEVPYLDTIKASYLDDDQKEISIEIPATAGPHRNFIGLDKLFRERGIMKIGWIGSAVCRLMDAGAILDATLEALRKNPAAVLCDNPACADCVMQKARIKSAMLARERFTLAALAGDISDDVDEIIGAVKAEGISSVELTAEEYMSYGAALTAAGIEVAVLRGSIEDTKAADLAKKLGVPCVVPADDTGMLEEALRLMRDTGTLIMVENRGATSSTYNEFYAVNPDYPRLAFNPGSFACMGEKPFLEVFYRGTLRRQTAHFYVDDRTFQRERVLPGMGNGEVKEIISILRCRGYSGVMTLRSPQKGKVAFGEVAEAFRRLLETM